MTNPLAPSLLLPPLISSAAMRAILDDRARLQRMLDFEAALTRAEAAVGVVPASVVDPIAAACRAEHYDLAALGAAAAAAGNLAGPLVDALTAEVAKTDAAAASCVHWGASGQDVMDTALVLELRVGIDALIGDLGRAIEAFTTLAGRQRRTATVARMSLRHALPMPFGLKVAGYAAALGRSRERLKRLRKDALVLQFGGSVGTLAALGDQGLNVTDRLSALLDLPAPEAPWHSYRDRLAEVASAFGILAGTCGKIGRDISLLMQDEVAEIFEPPTAPGGERGRCATPARPGRRRRHGGERGDDRPAAGRHHPGLRDAGARARPWDLAGRVGDLPGARARHLGRARRRRGSGAGDRGRPRSHAHQSRYHAGADHGRGDHAWRSPARSAGRRPASWSRRRARNAARDKSRLQDVLLADARVTAHLPAPVLARLFEPMSHQGAAQTFIDRLVGTLRTSAGKRP